MDFQSSPLLLPSLCTTFVNFKCYIGIVFSQVNIKTEWHLAYIIAFFHKKRKFEYFNDISRIYRVHELSNTAYKNADKRLENGICFSIQFFPMLNLLANPSNNFFLFARLHSRGYGSQDT